MDALELERPHGFLLWRGKKSAVLTDGDLPEGVPLEVRTGAEAFGVAVLGHPAQMLPGEARRKEWFARHRVTEQEIDARWPGAQAFKVYPLESFDAYEEIRESGSSDGKVEGQKEPKGAAAVAPDLFILKQHTGVMVGLFVDPADARSLALEGGELPEDLHVTLAYLGDSSELKDKDLLERVVARYAEGWGPIKGAVSGTGVFTGGEDGDVLWLHFDSGDLPGFRQRLVERLDAAGFPPKSDHGFTPHITLMYAPEIAAAPNVADGRELQFDRLTLAWGGDRTSYPLKGKTEAKMETDEKAVAGLAKHLLDKYGPEHLFSDCMGDETTQRYDEEARKAVCARVHKEAVGKWPAEKPKSKGADVTDDELRAVAEAMEADEKGVVKQMDLKDDEIKRLRERVAELEAEKARADDENEEEGGCTCPECGADVDCDEQECPECGAAMAGEDEEETEEAEKAKPMKTEAGEKHPAGHYLVVEDPGKPSTWHLRVRGEDGEPDHRLMGAAWAALHGGYRGNKYEGPDKSEAIAKLKKLYESEGMETPGGGEKAGRRVKKPMKDRLRDAWETIKDVLSWAEYEDAVEEGDAKALFEGEHGVAIKSVGGEPWMFTWTTNAFIDRDREIFSTKGLERYVEAAEEAGDRGTYDLWHIPGTDFADVKWQAVIGRYLVESGPFRDDAKGRAAREFFTKHPNRHPRHAPEGWGVSPEFRYLPEERKTGTFDNFWIVRRSVLPRMAAANVRTMGGSIMAVTEKQEEMGREIFGEDQFKEIVESAEAESTKHEAAGVAHKEAEPEPEPEPRAQEIDLEDLAMRIAKQFDVALEPLDELSAAVKALDARLGRLERTEHDRKEVGMPRFQLHLEKRASQAEETALEAEDALLKGGPKQNTDNVDVAEQFLSSLRAR